MNLSLAACLMLAATAPAFAQNDECAGALALGLGFSEPFDTTTATASGLPWSCAASSGPDLWFSFTAPFDGGFRVETCGSTFDTALELFTGSCGALSLVECNDDGCGIQSRIPFTATAGDQFFIRVCGFSVAAGAGVLTVLPNLPAADCNGNGVDDLVDIANGTSLDCDANGEPDECCGQLLTSDLAGGMDGFMGLSSTSPRACLASTFGPSMSFDDTQSRNQSLIHTVDGLPGFISAATLTLRIQPNDSTGINDSDNDSIALGFCCESGLFTWGRRIGTGGDGHNVPGILPFPWQNVGATTITLDLGALELLGGGTLSLLERMSTDGFLDILVGDDTGVDFLHLEYTTCADCNSNLVPDACDIDSGLLSDLNMDGFADGCGPCSDTATASLVDVVFLVDTSQSMNDYAASLCSSIAQIVSDLEDSGITTNYRIHGITQAPGGGFGCLMSHVASLYGTTVPVVVHAGSVDTTLGACANTSHNQGATEDWANATAIVARDFPWTAGAERIIIPISDEGPACGRPSDDKDTHSAENAALVASSYSVKVSPIIVRAQDVMADASVLADGSGGRAALISSVAQLPPTIFTQIGGTAACVAAPDDLVGWWTFDEASGQLAQDVVGGHVGVHRDFGIGSLPRPVEGEVDLSLQFDGFDDHVVVPDPADGSLDVGENDFSVDAWVRRTTDKTLMTIVDKRQPVTPDKGWWFYLQDGYLALRLADGTANTLDYTSGAFVPNDGRWHLAAVTVSRAACDGGIRFYLDSDLYDVVEFPAALGSLDNEGALFIGSSHPVLCNGAFAGCIDELEIFSRALRHSEICSLSNRLGKCKSGLNGNGFCLGNLVLNGSFERGNGVACSTNLGGLHNWRNVGDDEANWAGDNAAGDCLESDADRVATSGSLGDRFAHLKVDFNFFCRPRRREAIETNLVAPPTPGFKYLLSWKAISRRKWCNSRRGYLTVKVGSEEMQFGGNGGANVKILTGSTTIDTWSDYSHAFTATAGHTSPNRIRIDAVNGSRIALDEVCLVAIGGSNVRGIYAMDPPVGGTIGSPTGTSGGTIFGNPVSFDSNVGSALSFDGVNDSVLIGADPLLGFGFDDFSVSLHVQPHQSQVGFAPLLDARGAAGVGYLLFLQDGELRAQINDGVVSAVYPSGAVLEPGEWSNVAINYRRLDDEEGLELYVNGHRAAAFDATAHAGSVGTATPISLAAGRSPDLTGGTFHFRGALDEVMFVGGALTPGELVALGEEGGDGLDDRFLTTNASVSFGAADAAAETTFVLGNTTTEDITYAWSLAGSLAADSDDCDIDGPTSFVPSAGTTLVPAGGAVPVVVSVSRPLGLSSGALGCFEVTAVDTATNDVFSETCFVVNTAPWRISAAQGVTPVESGEVETVSFIVENLSDPSGTLLYEARATLGDHSVDERISLNGQLPGTSAPGVLTLPVGSSAVVTVDARILDDSASLLHWVSLAIDADGDNVLNSVASQALRVPSDNALGSLYCSPGVPNSTGSPGEIRALGSVLVADNNVEFELTGLPLNAGGFVIAGLNQAFVPMPGGSQGNLCVGAPVGRAVGGVFNTMSSGTATVSADLTAIPQPVGTVSVQPGETWSFQGWHRDSIGGAATSNFTNGVSIQFQ